MRLKTHYTFSLGLLYLIDSFFIDSPYYLLVMTLLVSVIVNNLIDSLGHEIKGMYISRTPRTHTIPRSVIWGLSVSIPFALALYFLPFQLPFNLNFHPSIKFLLVTVIDGAIAGLSHMLLDVFTEKGIYVKKKGRWRRFALAHFCYDNPLVNGLADLLGVLMLFLAFYIHDYNFIYHYYHEFFT